MIEPALVPDEVSGLLRAVVEGAFEGVVITDARLDEPGPTIVYVNHAFSVMTGYEPHEVIGRTPRILQGPDTDRSVIGRLRACLERGEPFEGEAVNYRKDGTPFWLEWRVLPIRDPAGTVTHYFAVQRDVSERHESSQKVAAEERRFRRLIEASLEVITILDGEGRMTFVSPSVERIFGWSPEQYRARDPFEMLHPEDVDRVVALGTELYRQPGGTARFTYRVKDASGTFRWVESLGRNLLEDPDVGGVVFTVRDVTDRQLAEEQLSRAEMMYRTLVEQIPAVVYIWETEEHVDVPAEVAAFELGYYTSPRIADLIGYTREEYDGQPFLWKELIHPEDRERVLAASAHSERTGEIFDERYRLRHRDGRWVWVHDVASLFLRDDAGNPWLLQGLMLNVTDRMEAEHALHLAEERYRSLVLNLPAVVYVESIEGDPDLFYISPQIEELTGYPPERFHDPAFFDTIVHPDDRERVVERDVRTSTATRTFHEEYRLVHADGHDVWVYDSAVQLDDDDGRVWQGVMLDVTDRKAAEERLRDSLERFRALAANVPVGIFQTNAAGRCFYVNERWTEITGMSAERARGTGWADALHPEDRASIERAWNETAAAGTLFEQEYRFVAPDGTERWVLGSARPVRDAAGAITGYLGTVADISEQKRAEEALRASVHQLGGSLETLRKADRDRRELLGSLVEAQEAERAALAEDIIDDPIQKMAAVGMRLEALRRSLSDPEQLGAIDQLGSAVSQVTERLRGMLFELRPRTLDQDGLAAALRGFLHQAAEGGPSWSVDDQMLMEPPTRSRAVAYRIAQEAIANVIDHAGAGRLGVTLGSEGEWFTVDVIDDGAGFDQTAVHEGLGLAGMRERAELEGGSVTVTSTPGRGTSVRIRLPL